MGLLCLMSVLVVGIGAVRSRLVPTWVGVLLIAAPFPIFFAGSGVVIALSGIPLAVGMYQIARAAARATS